MEMMAAIMALEALKRPSKVALYTDSNYLRDSIMKWIHGWKRNGWRTADKKPVKNVDLWQRLELAVGRHDVTWHWVKGRSEEHTSELQSLMRISYAVFCWKKKITREEHHTPDKQT